VIAALRRRSLALPIGLAALTLAVAFPLLAKTPLFSQYAFWIFPVTEMFVFGVAVLSFNLLFGYTGLMSFGHALFFGGAGYVIGVMTRNLGVGYLTAVPVALVVILLVALVVGAIVVRLGGVYFAMITLAFAMIGHEAVVYFNEYTGGYNGLSALNIPEVLSEPLPVYYLSLTTLVVSFLLLWRIVNTPFGRVIVAIRENEQRVGMLGINTYRFKLFAFLMSAFFAAVAGVIYPLHLQFISPGIVNWTTTGDILIMTLLGGANVFWGPILGVITFVGLETQLGIFTDRWRLVLGAIFVVVVLFVPNGLAGLVNRAKTLASRCRSGR